MSMPAASLAPGLLLAEQVCMLDENGQVSDDFVPLDFSRLQALAHRLRRAAQIEEFYTESDPTWAGGPGSVAATDS